MSDVSTRERPLFTTWYLHSQEKVKKKPALSEMVVKVDAEERHVSDNSQVASRLVGTSNLGKYESESTGTWVGRIVRQLSQL